MPPVRGSDSWYFSTQAAVALRRRPQHRSIGGFGDIFVSLFFFGAKLRDRRGGRSWRGKSYRFIFLFFFFRVDLHRHRER